MKKALLTTILCLVAIIGFAQTTFTDGDLNYEVIPTAPGLAKVTGTNISQGTQPH